MRVHFCQKPVLKGFTLIELSIVLVVIGLIVGGVLVGRELISAAAIRAQISQITQYKQAVYTFRVKYGHLPGDMPANEAMRVGLYRTNSPNITGCDGYYSSGCGNGDGIIAGNSDSQNGEAQLFWLDLSLVNLIPFKPPTYSYSTGTANPSDFLPKAILGSPHYIYVVPDNASNYLTVSGVLEYCGFLLGYASGCDTINIMRVSDAFGIDSKMDDGRPQSGSVIAKILGYSGSVCGSGSSTSFLWVGASSTGCWGDPTTSATAGSATTCYDNNSVNGADQQYSISQNSGTGTNCALAFKF